MALLKTVSKNAVAALMLGAAAMTLPLIAAPAAMAADSKATVDAAKGSGTVGERADGYLGVVGSASADVKAAVDDINIRRKSHYTKLAAEKNVSVAVIAALTGEKLIANASRGEKIMSANGSWTTK